jgi:pyruvate-ferredoxin/flavodoxin oxidoreductase
MTYGSIYVATTSHLANPEHALKCLREASEFEGPAIVINYAPCTNHGIRGGMANVEQHCKDLANAGYLLLLRFDPRRKADGLNPLQLDSKLPTFDVAPVLKGENRFASLKDIHPEEAALKFPLMVQDLKDRWNRYEKMAAGK